MAYFSVSFLPYQERNKLSDPLYKFHAMVTQRTPLFQQEKNILVHLSPSYFRLQGEMAFNQQSSKDNEGRKF